MYRAERSSVDRSPKIAAQSLKNGVSPGGSLKVSHQTVVFKTELVARKTQNIRRFAGRYTRIRVIASDLAEGEPVMEDTPQSAKRTTKSSIGKAAKGFTAEERAAMKA